MANNNDIIDLTNVAALDNYVIAATFVDGTLVLHLVDGPNVTVDISSLGDIFTGNKWDNTNTYVAGDIVSDGAYAYIALRESTGKSPLSNTDDWVPVVRLQWNGAGTLWDSERTYALGDLVTDGRVPMHTYASLSSNNKNNPLPVDGITNTYWQVSSTIYYNATTGGQPVLDGMHNPDISVTFGTEYPDTTAESSGAVWYIQGLGSVNGIKNEHEFVVGGLQGITVVDGDKITWASGDNDGVPGDGSESWLHTESPKVIAERGGLLWQSHLFYVVGDVVTYGEISYMSRIGSVDTPNNNVIPLDNPTEWKTLSLEYGGRLYSSIVQYSIGDVVTVNGIMYVIGEDSTNPGNPPPAGTLPGDPEWAQPVTVEPERGGILWDAETQYRIGDVVTVDGVVYVIGSDSTSPGNPPPAGTLPGDPEWLDPTVIEPERGGIAWKPGNQYFVNDIVGWVDETGFSTPYICVAEHISGDAPEDDKYNWSSMKFDKSTAMPNPYNLPISHPGDTSFLSLSMQTDYKGSTYYSRIKDVILPGNDGLLYLYQIRSNYSETRMYISTISQDLSKAIFTDTEYRSGWLPDDEYIDFVYNYTADTMAVRTNKISTPGVYNSYLVHFNNDSNPVYHTAISLAPLASNVINTGDNFVYVKELNVILYSSSTTVMTTVSVYDYNDLTVPLSIIDGIDVSDNINSIKLQDGGTSSSLTEPETAKLHYELDGDIIRVKSFGRIIQYVDTYYYFAHYVDNIEFDSANGYNPTLVAPLAPYSYPILMDNTNKTEGNDSGILNYDNLNSWNEENSVFIYNILYTTTSEIVGGYTMRTVNHYISKEELGEIHGYIDYHDIFEKNFGWGALSSPLTKNVILPDNSVVGKGVGAGLLLLLNKSSVDTNKENFAIASSSYSDNNAIVYSSAIISGVDINNLETYIPTKIEEIIDNPLIVGLEDDLNTVYYDAEEYIDAESKTVHTIQSMNNYADIISNIRQDVFSFDVGDGVVQGWFDDIIAADPLMYDAEFFGLEKGPVYNVIYIPGTQYALFSCTMIFKATGDELRSSKGFYSIIDLSTYTQMFTPIEYMSILNDSTLDDNTTLSINKSTAKMAAWTNGDDVFFWSLLLGYDTNGGGPSPHAIRIIINKTSGAIIDSKFFDRDLAFGSGAVFDTHSLCVHPTIGFFSSSSRNVYYLACEMVGLNAGGDTPEFDSWSYEGITREEHFVTVRSSNEIKVTFDSYPVMFNGYYQMIAQKTYTEPTIKTNAKQYIYIISDTDGEFTYVFEDNYVESSLIKIYVGWIETDAISIIASYTVKEFIIGGFIFNSNSEIKPLISDTTDIGKPHAMFADGYFNGIILKDTVDDSLHKLTISSGSLVVSPI